MTNLRIEHKGKDYHYSIAENWDEVPAYLVQWIAPKLQAWKAQYYKWVDAVDSELHTTAQLYDVELQQIRIEILRRFCGIGRWPFSRSTRAFYAMETPELADVLLTLNFVFTDLDRTEPVPRVFRIKRKAYFSPYSSFSNISGAEFHFADLAYAKYLDSGNMESLNQLVGILYRVRGTGDEHTLNHFKFIGDIRCKFNRFQIETNGQIMSKISIPIKVGIFFWWQCFRQNLQKIRPDIFSSKNEGKAKSGNGWIPIFRSMSKHPLQFDGVADLRLVMLLMELRETIREAKEAERRRKENK